MACVLFFDLINIVLLGSDSNSKLYRTPIHGILGLTALLLESQLTADQRESLMSVKECADLLLHIINSVLDLSKIEAGRLEVETVPFSIRKMVSSTLRIMQARAQTHNLQLLWHIDGEVPDSVVGDPGKLQQCLLNLGMLFLGFMVLVTLFTYHPLKCAYAPQDINPSIDTVEIIFAQQLHYLSFVTAAFD